MDEYEGEEGEGCKMEEGETPHIALNNEGLQGVWAICELGDQMVHSEIEVIAFSGRLPSGYNGRFVSTKSQHPSSYFFFPKRDLHENSCNSKKTKKHSADHWLL